ncbi:hypothetical protein Desor_4380 [Desulfosporosinus orientis DSM 765]|uniref:Uncharacterized protein n=1 Tax=Desulfosporosinus orientis (strain ATCC 19365 / DSM 765 / NCIMB 8382 / VKM B-1628 / Singapore I) TaxID=768706 RepID=G7WJE4_DESOD|nr:hypothetical protein [Desulfosporosinus orientis]AET69803.1 hypothetical protein Desor_4380 [Desulfosporosinus orientis DSM 765]
MDRQELSDFEIGYDYVRRRYSSLAKHSYQDLWKLGIAYLQTKGADAELSRGMGFYFLELGIRIRLAEITSDH